MGIYLWLCALAFWGVARTFLELWLDSKIMLYATTLGEGQKISTNRSSSLRSFQLRSGSQKRKREKILEGDGVGEDMDIWAVLKGILRHESLHHFLKFVEAVMLLSQAAVSPVDIQTAERLFLDFTKGVQFLYGATYCSYNCHILRHASKCLQNWGPL